MKKQSGKQSVIPILASGKGWLAVDKPAGMSVHNDPGRDLGSLLAVRLQTDAALQAATGLDGKSRLNAVNRLDRETSGVLLMAGDRLVFSHFAAQFERRLVKKIYTVILHGHLPPAASADKRHAWKWPLTKTPGGRKDPGGRGPKKACTTLVRILDHSEHYTLAECRLLTGRTHQIRRHAKLAGHFVVGDRRYGSSRALEFLQRRHNFVRLGLHATSLAIRLPDGSPAVLRSTSLPDEMQRLFSGDRPGADPGTAEA